MKLSRKGLRRLIESVISEQSNEGPPSYEIRKIGEFDALKV